MTQPSTNAVGGGAFQGTFVAALAACAITSGLAVAAAWCGAHVAIPTGFLLQTLVVSVPFAICVLWFGTWPLLRWSDWPFAVRWGAPIVAGILATWMYLQLAIWWVGTLVAIATWDRRRQARPGVVALPLLIIFTAGYWGVWLANSASAGQPFEDLRDPALVALDRWMYGRLFGMSSYASIFPLVRSDILFSFFERAYVVLFGELTLLVVLLSAGHAAATGVRVLAVLFAGYVVGMAVFAVYPTVGPCIFAPESFDPAFRTTLTGRMMHNMALDFGRAQGQPTGYAYFVALPSLHAAVSLYLQWVLRRIAGVELQAFFLPINVASALSTVLLGYHYLVDLPAGLLLGVCMGASFDRLAARSAEPETA